MQGNCWPCLAVFPCVPGNKIARVICLALSTVSALAVILCVIVRAVTGGDGEVDHPIARGGNAGEGGGDGGDADQHFTSRTNDQIALFNVHVGSFDTRISLAMGVGGAALAVGILLLCCNSAVCIRHGWTVRPQRAARRLRQQGVEQTVESRLLDHHQQLQLISDHRHYQQPARRVFQVMQRDAEEVLAQLLEAGVISPALTSNQSDNRPALNSGVGRGQQWQGMPAAPIHHAVDIPELNRFAAAGIRPT